MKIIGIARNYSEHAKELNNEVPKEPFIFLMPDTALLRNNNDFYHPEFSKNIDHEIELVVKISQIGKSIPAKFAHKYYTEIALGIDFTARDIQKEAAQKGLPWTLAKGFDYACPISEFFSVENFDLNNIDLELKVNNETKQKGNTSEMIYDVNHLIEYVSKYFTLKKGDLIYTGTPAGVSQVKIGDHLQGYLNGKKLIDFKIL